MTRTKGNHAAAHSRIFGRYPHHLQPLYSARAAVRIIESGSAVSQGGPTLARGNGVDVRVACGDRNRRGRVDRAGESIWSHRRNDCPGDLRPDVALGAAGELDLPAFCTLGRTDCVIGGRRRFECISFLIARRRHRITVGALRRPGPRPDSHGSRGWRSQSANNSSAPRFCRRSRCVACDRSSCRPTRIQRAEKVASRGNLDSTLSWAPPCWRAW